MAPTRDTTGVIAQLTRSQQRNQNMSMSSPQLPGRFEGDLSTVTSFQPDQESTQQFDTAADQRSWAGHDSLGDQDSGDGDSDTRSIEIGRGVKGSLRNSTGHPAFADDLSEEQLLDLGDNSLYDLTMTPPARHPSMANRRPIDLRKQATNRRAQQERDAEATKTSDIIPVKTRSKPSAGRRTLSDMHAKINAISDSSFIHPDPVSTKSRTSRFSGTRAASVNAAVPSLFTSGAGLHSQAARAARRTEPEDVSIVGNQTAQSFMLPDLPNIAELVSGLRKDGTPVFARTSKPRSRFTSVTYARDGESDHTGRPHIDTIGLPAEEKAIFTSLQLLKEKVAQLEADKAEADKKTDEYENEISGLRSRMQMERRLRRSDGAVISDEERDDGSNWRVERGQLNASLRTMQDRLKRSDRKLAVSDIAIKRITQERDSLITQLGVAFYSNEELKELNAQLSLETEVLEKQKETLQHDLQDEQATNKELQSQLQQSEKQHSDDLRRWSVREAELKARYKKRVSTEQHARQTDAYIPQTRRQQRENGQESQARILERVEQEVRKARAEAVRQSKVSSEQSAHRIDKARSRSRSHARPSANAQRRSLPVESVAPTFRDRWLDNWSDDGVNQISTHKATKMQSTMQQNEVEDEDSKDMTLLSYLDPAELSALRRKLEAERLASKEHRSSSAPVEGENVRARTVQRKSSLRDMTQGLDRAETTRKGASTPARNVRVQSPATADAISYSDVGEINGTGDVSVLSTTSRRPQRSKSFEEMTSAFILPDITMRIPSSNAANSTSSAPAVPHNKASCTACPQPAGTATTSSTVPIPTPIPVSQRNDDDIDATTATVRPAQDPTHALATVLKQLQDEIVHLKLKLATKERAYAAHDPALGKRKRVQLKADIDALLREIEKRSDWVYRLYDVVEGQKDEGADAAVDETLRSLGIEVGAGPFAGRGIPREDGSDVESVDVVEGGLAY